MQEEWTIDVHGRGMYELTPRIRAWIAERQVRGCGLLHLFTRHTSCSLLIQENADPDVQHDMELYLSRLVEDGYPGFRHRNEGDDDMSAHIRSALLGVSLNIPVRDGRLLLGTWQGVFLYEHRRRRMRRHLLLHLQMA